MYRMYLPRESIYMTGEQLKQLDSEREDGKAQHNSHPHPQMYSIYNLLSLFSTVRLTVLAISMCMMHYLRT